MTLSTLIPNPPTLLSGSGVGTEADWRMGVSSSRRSHEANRKEEVREKNQHVHAVDAPMEAASKWHRCHRGAWVSSPQGAHARTIEPFNTECQMGRERKRGRPGREAGAVPVAAEQHLIDPRRGEGGVSPPRWRGAHGSLSTTVVQIKASACSRHGATPRRRRLLLPSQNCATLRRGRGAGDDALESAAVSRSSLCWQAAPPSPQSHLLSLPITGAQRDATPFPPHTQRLPSID